MYSSNICYLQSLGQAVIPGNSFKYILFLIEKIDHNGISTSKFGKTITLMYIDEPHAKYVCQLRNNYF